MFGRFIICLSLLAISFCEGEVFDTKAFPFSIQDILNFKEYEPTFSGVTKNIYKPTPELIRLEGYPVEEHVVQTEDGYLLTMHRVPGSPSSPPSEDKPAFLLQHALTCSSYDWIMMGKDKGLAYLLADRGFDVWIANSRGNTYSRKHTTLSASDPEFWDFSHHELGVYDLPAMINYIINHTNAVGLQYVGHSLGTTSFFVMASERPDVAVKVLAMYSLGTSVFLENIKSPVKYLAPFIEDFGVIERFIGNGELLPQTPLLRLIELFFCDASTMEKKLCNCVNFLISGFDSAQFNYTILPEYLAHTPAGASTKCVIHLIQGIQSGEFRQYDYGREKNLKVYNSISPPDYDFSKITSRIYLFHAENDWLATLPNLMRLCDELPVKATIYKVPLATFNHVDYVVAKDKRELVYEKLILWAEENRS